MIVMLPVYLLKLKSIVHRKKELSEFETRFIDGLCKLYLDSRRCILSETQKKRIDEIYVNLRHGRDFHINEFIR